ncbi:hypothetical protein Efla_001769 [Eimeria flavescens]
MADAHSTAAAPPAAAAAHDTAAAPAAAAPAAAAPAAPAPAPAATSQRQSAGEKPEGGVNSSLKTAAAATAAAATATAAAATAATAATAAAATAAAATAAAAQKREPLNALGGPPKRLQTELRVASIPPLNSRDKVSSSSSNSNRGGHPPSDVKEAASRESSSSSRTMNGSFRDRQGDATRRHASSRPNDGTSTSSSSNSSGSSSSSRDAGSRVDRRQGEGGARETINTRDSSSNASRGSSSSSSSGTPRDSSSAGNLKASSSSTRDSSSSSGSSSSTKDSSSSSSKTEAPSSSQGDPGPAPAGSSSSSSSSKGEGSKATPNTSSSSSSSSSSGSSSSSSSSSGSSGSSSSSKTGTPKLSSYLLLAQEPQRPIHSLEEARKKKEEAEAPKRITFVSKKEREARQQRQLEEEAEEARRKEREMLQKRRQFLQQEELERERERRERQKRRDMERAKEEQDRKLREEQLRQQRELQEKQPQRMREGSILADLKLLNLPEQERRAKQQQQRQRGAEEAAVAAATASAQASKASEKKKAKDLEEEPELEGHWSMKKREELTERDWRIFREDFEIYIKGGRVPPPIRTWAEAELPWELIEAINQASFRTSLRITPQGKSLQRGDEEGEKETHGLLRSACRVLTHKANYERPTPIQMQAIPIALEMRDLIGIAETGSGKTAAFVLPMLTYVKQLPPLTEETSQDGPYALILAPSRELALQIEEETQKFASFCKCRTVAVVGGRSAETQAFLLRQGVEIVIGTPGRIRDCLERAYTVLNQCNYVVLDEADRMIDLGFEEVVNAILDAIPTSNLKSEDEALALQQEMQAKAGHRLYRLTQMFSATMPPALERLARSYLRAPSYISIGDPGAGKRAIEQRVEFLSEARKKQRLQARLSLFRCCPCCAAAAADLLEESEPPVMVFVNQKKSADALAKALSKLGFSTIALHGGKAQENREAALSSFKEGSYDVLVATDVAGRGIDVEGVTLVINFDMPKEIEQYLHRIGRTGRAGKKGVAISFLTEEDSPIYFDLVKVMKSTNSPVPIELQNHPASKVKGGTKDSVPVKPMHFY